jgi:hypothetical protein
MKEKFYLLAACLLAVGLIISGIQCNNLKKELILEKTKIKETKTVDRIITKYKDREVIVEKERSSTETEKNKHTETDEKKGRQASGWCAGYLMSQQATPGTVYGGKELLDFLGLRLSPIVGWNFERGQLVFGAHASF